MQNSSTPNVLIKFHLTIAELYFTVLGGVLSHFFFFPPLIYSTMKVESLRCHYLRILTVVRFYEP